LSHRTSFRFHRDSQKRDFLVGDYLGERWLHFDEFYNNSGFWLRGVVELHWEICYDVGDDDDVVVVDDGDCVFFVVGKCKIIK
jgi:hypothetical protein